MAINKVQGTATLRLVLDTGSVNKDGDPVVKSKNFASIKAATSDEILHQTGQILAGLQQLAINKIIRLDQSELVSVKIIRSI